MIYKLNLIYTKKVSNRDFQIFTNSDGRNFWCYNFYSRFSLEPKGKYNISVCLGTACFVKGSQAIFDRLKERLKLEDGKTSADGKFSIDTTRCVGACGIAPVFTVNNEVYGHATVKKLDEVLDKLEKKDSKYILKLFLYRILILIKVI